MDWTGRICHEGQREKISKGKVDSKADDGEGRRRRSGHCGSEDREGGEGGAIVRVSFPRSGHIKAIGSLSLFSTSRTYFLSLVFRILKRGFWTSVIKNK